MRRKIYILSAVVGLLLVPTGCIYDDLPGDSSATSDPGGKEQFTPRLHPDSLATVVLSAKVASQGDTESCEGGSTRAGTSIQSTQFDNNETFFAYFATAGVRIGNVDGDNVIYTTDGAGNAAPATQPYFPAACLSVDVHGYYPSSVTNTTSSFTVQQDQTSTANYKASDLMYATCAATRNAGDPTGSGSLTFNHRMVKIIVSATADTNKGVNTVNDIRIVGGHRTINIATPLSCTLGTTTSDANSTSDYVTIYTGGSTATATGAALVVPETSFTGSFLQVITDMGTATYSLSAKELVSGSLYL